MDGEAVAWATGLLRARSESLKVLLVLSDGHPEGGSDPTAEARHLRDMVA